MVEKMRVLVQQNVMQLSICVRLVRQNDISAQHTYAKGGFDIRGFVHGHDGAAGLTPDLAQQGKPCGCPRMAWLAARSSFTAILQRVMAAPNSQMRVRLCD